MKRLSITLFTVLALFMGNITQSMNSEADDLGSIRLVLVQQGQDLSMHKDFHKARYSEIAKEGCQEVVKQSAEAVFDVMEGWIGQKGKEFLEIYDDQKFIGFTVFEYLEQEGVVAVYAAPTLQEYAHLYVTGFGEKFVKSRFPDAKKIAASCSAHLEKARDILDAAGYKKDDSHACNQEVIDALKKFPELLSGLQGYSKSIK